MIEVEALLVNDRYIQHYQKLQKRFTEMQSQYLETKKSSDSLASVDAYYAESAKYFAEPVALKEMQQLWAGIHCDDTMINHLFNHLLPEYQFEKNVEKIEVPCLIAGGQKDYDSVPLEIWKQYPLPKNVSFLDCGRVGHWPHLEAADIFDKGVWQWISSSRI